MAKNKPDASLGRSLEWLAEKLQSGSRTRRGDIVFVVTGERAGQYTLECTPGAVSVSSTAGRGDRTPLIEVIGDAKTLQAVLDGERDAREQFLQGGLRVRGDLRYLSDVALELGILKAPL